MRIIHAGAIFVPMKRNPQIIAFMTPFPYSIDADAPLEDAHKLLRQHKFRHLPVMSGGAISGVLTDRDINLIARSDVVRREVQFMRVRDAVVEEACVVSASTPVATVARMMADRQVGSAIVTKHDKLVGIFTVTDACRALAEVLGDRGDETPDAA
jgi:acetoin utilization protein AcuB